MNSIFKITVSAVDGVTKQTQKMNNSISMLVRPISQVGRSFKQLGAEMGRSMPYKALATTYKGIRSIGGVATDVGKKLAGFGLVGATALAEMTREWMNTGAEIGRFSETMGVSTDDLQTWRGAAELAGISAGTMTASMKALGDTMQDAVNSRNDDAFNLLAKLRISIKQTGAGAQDTVQMLRDLARAITDPKIKGHAQMQSAIARQLNVEALLPLLRKGPQEIDRLLAASKSFGIESPQAIQAAGVFQEKLKGLELSALAARDAIGSKLIPVLQPWIEKLTKWVNANEELVSHKIGEWAEDFSKWLKEIDWDKVAKGARELGSELMTIKDALVAIASVTNTAKLIFGKDSGSPGGVERVDAPGTAGASELFARLGRKYAVPAQLLDSVWSEESSRGRNMLSPKGAQGHFGFMPATQKEYGLKDPNNLEESADAAARKLSGLLRRYHGNVAQAAGAYNWGEGNAERYGFDNAPPETQKYMADITRMMGKPQEVVVRVEAAPGTRATVVKGGREGPGRIGNSMPLTQAAN